MTRSLVLLAALALPSWAAADEPLALHLTAGVARPVTPVEDKELEGKFRVSQTVVEELEKALKKQFGKKPEAWPEPQAEELRLARDASAQAQTDWFYSGIPQKDIDDTIRDLTEKIGEKPTLRLVASAAEADFEVLVIGRGKVIRSLGFGGPEAAAEVAMRVASGGRLDAAALAKDGAGFRAKKSLLSRSGAFAIHDYSADGPYWLLISRKPQIGFSFPWKGASGQAADAFERFMAENATRVASARQVRAARQDSAGRRRC
jgi:hypothetical protein